MALSDAGVFDSHDVAHAIENRLPAKLEGLDSEALQTSMCG
jgi:hypothetical protein